MEPSTLRQPPKRRRGPYGLNAIDHNKVPRTTQWRNQKQKIQTQELETGEYTKQSGAYVNIMQFLVPCSTMLLSAILIDFTQLFFIYF